MITFNFWKENKIAAHYTLTGTEITERIYPWLKSKEKDWLEYYSSDTIIRAFITEKEGLNSTFEEAEFDDIYHVLKPSIRWHMNQLRSAKT